MNKLLIPLMLLFSLQCYTVQAKEKAIINSLQQSINVLKKNDLRKSYVIDSLNKSINARIVTFDIKDWEKKKAVFDKQEDFWSKNMSAIVGILALLFSVLTTHLTIRGTRKNERVKFERESLENKKSELKELVAQFIKYGTRLNKILYKVYNDIDEGRQPEAKDSYDKTIELRNKLIDTYYSIKVSLDASIENKEIEKVIDLYLNKTCFEFEISTFKVDDFEQPIAKLYHKIKAIIHTNYKEPV